jgi:(2R)-3-sulfolactate dehydrogenase (NADP+)
MSAPERIMSLDEVEAMSFERLLAVDVATNVAKIVARSIRRAEADGIRSHGLARLATYSRHARIGKVDGWAVPELSKTGPASICVNARYGFAHPAIELGIAELKNLAREMGIAVLAVTKSYNCGVLGHHVEEIAEAGFVGLGFVNAPPSIAPWGGRKPIFGTNPIALAAPLANRPPMVIDQSSSVIARGEIMLHAQQEKPIPPEWAITADGKPTTDPKEALKGSLLPSGGYKGAGLALMVEVMAAVLTGANLSIDASSFADDSGGPPATGQLFIAVDIGRLAGKEKFNNHLERVISAMISQAGVRLPGDKRLKARALTAREGVRVPEKLLSALFEKSKR